MSMCLFMYVNIVLCVYVWSRGGLIVCLVIVNVNNITSVDIRMLIYKNEAMTYVCVWLTVTFISRWSLIVINTQYVYVSKIN